MMSKVLVLFRPTTVVELRSRFVKKNYKANLKNHVKRLSNGCEFFQFQAIPESLEAKNMRAKDLWGIPEPKKLRDISILAYLGQCSPHQGKIDLILFGQGILGMLKYYSIK